MFYVKFLIISRVVLAFCIQSVSFIVFKQDIDGKVKH